MNIIYPKCKSDNITPIIYGYPTLKAREKADRGEILLGGIVHIDKVRIKKFYDDLLYWFKPWSYAIAAMVCDGCSYEVLPDSSGD